MLEHIVILGKHEHELAPLLVNLIFEGNGFFDETVVLYQEDV